MQKPNILLIICFTFILLLTLKFNLIAEDHFAPPTFKPGDNEIVETTVGAMRKALWYYEMHPILLDRIKEVELQRDNYKSLVLTCNESLKDSEKKVETWRIVAGITICTTIIITIIGIIK